MKKMNGDAGSMDGMVEKGGGGDAEVPAKKPKQKTTVEEIYQKKSQLEHILLRPDTYIGNAVTVNLVLSLLTNH